jgi:4-amino-4-deoxy-L-arabinose transferase-like glycosyltransferase
MLANILKRIDRWRFCLIVFAAVYGVLLAQNLSSSPLVWDEVSHLSGGLLLSRGQVGTWALTNSFYPPIYDVFTAFYFLVFSPSIYAARLVSVTFSVLTLFVIFETANLLYGSKKIALLSVVLFAVIPGIVWLSRMAMIESLLIFVVTLDLFFFFRWLSGNHERDRVLSVVLFLVGGLVKLQVLVVVPLFLFAGTYLWKRTYFECELKKWFSFPRLALMVAALAVVVSVACFLVFSGTVDYLLYAFGVGSSEKAIYSSRFLLPFFYFIEIAWVDMTWLSHLLHPISVLLYLVSLAGLGLMVYKRKIGDQYLLLWFAVAYIVFTAVPNREWRYLTITFPALAIAASVFIVGAFGRFQRHLQTATTHLSRWGIKLAAVALFVFLAAGVFFSCVDAYTWVAADKTSVPVAQASFFAVQGLGSNQTLAVVCPVNHFNKYMVSYYLSTENPAQSNQTCQYPEAAVDTFPCSFSVSEFAGLCRQRNAAYVLLYENENQAFFNSSLTELNVYGMLLASGNFVVSATFGVEPNRIFVMQFKG